jgi:RNA polymerase sigma factor (sigma-70 family)
MRNIRSSACTSPSDATAEREDRPGWQQGGGDSAFLSQFLPHLPSTRRYAAHKVPADDLEDVMQESLLRILNQSRRGQIHHPKSYLMMTVRAVIVDRMRHDTSRQRKNHCELVDANHPADILCPCRIVMGRQELESAIERLNALPQRTREMLFAVRLEGIGFKAVAARYKVSVSAVEKQVASALAYLAAGL